MIGLRWVNFERNRIPLSADLVRSAGATGLNGTETRDYWLVVLRPGRYRLAGKEAVSDILRQIEKMESTAGVLDDTENDPHDSIPARLIPCTVSPPPPMWRLNFPKEARLLVPEAERGRLVSVLIVAGFIEVWFPDTLRRALATPVSEVFE